MGFFRARTQHILWTFCEFVRSKPEPCEQSCFSVTNEPFPVAQRAVYVPTAPVAPLWSLQSPEPPSSQGQGIHLFLSQPITARLQPRLFTLSPCCPYTLCISSSLCHLDFSVTSPPPPSYTHTFPSDCIPCPPPVPAGYKSETILVMRSLPVTESAELYCMFVLAALCRPLLIQYTFLLQQSPPPPP